MMRTVALFHSVLGVREGIALAADRLREAGFSVLVVDQYAGRTFDDYDEAGEYAASIGYPVLMRRALDGVAAVPDGFAAVGFSNGAGMSTFVAGQRRLDRVVLCSGALPLQRIGMAAWPSGVPAQLHYTLNDPFRQDGWVESVQRSVNEAGAVAEYIQYPGAGHLFTDPSLPAEFDAASAEALWDHVTRFLRA
jgi:dienelactone hydrolase